MYMTTGYLDKSIIDGGEYSAMTDGYALLLNITTTGCYYHECDCH